MVFVLIIITSRIIHLGRREEGIWVELDQIVEQYNFTTVNLYASSKCYLRFKLMN